MHDSNGSALVRGLSACAAFPMVCVDRLSVRAACCLTCPCAVFFHAQTGFDFQSFAALHVDSSHARESVSPEEINLYSSPLFNATDRSSRVAAQEAIVGMLKHCPTHAPIVARRLADEFFVHHDKYRDAVDRDEQSQQLHEAESLLKPLVLCMARIAQLGWIHAAFVALL